MIDPVSILTQIINILFGGISTSAAKFGEGLNDLMAHLFLQFSEGAVTSSLSIFGIFVCIMAAVSITIGLGRLAIKFFTSWGKNRYM